MQRSNNARAIGGCRFVSSAHARMRTAQAVRAAATMVRLLLPLTSLCAYLSFTFPVYSLFRSRDILLSSSFFRAAAGLRQLSELRLLLSFFCKRKRTKKAFRGGVPPPRKLPLPRLGRAASRHRLSDASVWHLKCGAAI